MRHAATDSSTSSMSRRGAADPRIADLFDTFAAMWPRKWKTTPQSGRVWAMVLASLTDHQIAAGVRALATGGDEWPPEPGRFAAVARNAAMAQRALVPEQRRESLPPTPREDAWGACVVEFSMRMIGRRATRARVGAFDVAEFVGRVPAPRSNADEDVRESMNEMRAMFSIEWKEGLAP